MTDRESGRPVLPASMQPLGYPECHTAFGWNLEQWIYFGGYPGAASFTENESSWKRYITDSLIETVLARDVLQMSKIAKPVLLRHLFVLAATLPAQFVSYTKMLGHGLSLSYRIESNDLPINTP